MRKNIRFKFRLLIVAVFGVALMAGVAGIIINKSKSLDSNQSGDSKQSSNQQVDKGDSKNIRLIATGDMIPHDAINQQAKQTNGAYDYYAMFGDMDQIFGASDLRFCNQATLAGGSEFGVSGYPKFNAPIELTKDMAKLGCNVVNTGSNHVNDFSQEVISASVKGWNGLPGVLAVAGANSNEVEMNKVRYFEKDGVKFAFLSYTTYSNEPSPSGYSVTMYSAELAKEQLTEAKQKADVIIVSMRWGTEYSDSTNSSQKTIASNLASLGADIVFGHGPHVLQPVERIDKTDGEQTLVWYSLGNFLNAQLDPPSLFNCVAVMKINKESKTVTSAECLPIYMHYEWTKEQKLAGELMSRHNFKIYTFDDAEVPLSKSQNNTTLQAQKDRISQTINKLTQVKVISKKDYFLQN